MLLINTGNGKGKTTAAMGQILRSLGRGWKVCLIQLFKGEAFYAEQKILTTLPHLDFYSYAPRHPFCFPEVPKQQVRRECLKALDRFATALKSKKRYQLIVLEEFNIAMREKYLTYRELASVIDTVPSNIHVIITGRGAPKQLIARADLVTEMKEIKHPFNKGITAQKGIEF